MRVLRSIRSVLVVAVALCCPSASAPGKGSDPKKETATRPIFDSRQGIAKGWMDLGWAPRQLERGGPARIDFSGHGGWILANSELVGTYVGLTLRMRAPASFGEFLDVRLDSARPGQFPRVRPKPEERRQLPDGSVEVRVAMTELNPRGAPFDRVVLQAFREVGPDQVLVEHIALIEGTMTEAPARAQTARMSVDCAAAPRPISPLIYGIAHGDSGWWETGATARRWGGNPNSRYNWELGNAWNTGSDWFFRNYGGGGSAWQGFLDENRTRDVRSALTVPMIGWVAKDHESYSFPVSVFGPQRAVDPQNPDIGNGVAPDGNLLTPLSPTRTSVPAPPSFIARWVSAIRERDKTRGRSVHEYILDNEPTLWDTTHRDVHPDPVGYDELLERTIRYGTAIREADPEAVIAGFVGWGWTGYFYSAKDAKPSYALKVDRRDHGDEPLLPWWLKQVSEHEKRGGKRLIDVLDVHYYPQGQDLGLGSGGGTDPATAARRIRSTHSLWDPTYVDESWVNESVKLIPRLHDWVDQHAPGLGISIGEYNFGAEGHMSGGLALAEVLGRFGQGGLTSAFYWTAPPKNTPAFWAFRAFRNFDGKGARFLDLSVPARSDGKLASIFASRDASGKHLVAILLQLDPAAPTTVEIDVSRCGEVKSRRIFAYTGGPAGFAAVTSRGQTDKGILRERLPPYSITVLDLQLSAKR